MTEQTDLARLCLEYRATHNLSQAQMSRLCGFKERTIISKIESGKSVSKVTETKLRMGIERRK